MVNSSLEGSSSMMTTTRFKVSDEDDLRGRKYMVSRDELGKLLTLLTKNQYCDLTIEEKSFELKNRIVLNGSGKCINAKVSIAVLGTILADMEYKPSKLWIKREFTDNDLEFVESIFKIPNFITKFIIDEAVDFSSHGSKRFYQILNNSKVTELQVEGRICPHAFCAFGSPGLRILRAGTLPDFSALKPILEDHTHYLHELEVEIPSASEEEAREMQVLVNAHPTLQVLEWCLVSNPPFHYCYPKRPFPYVAEYVVKNDKKGWVSPGKSSLDASFVREEATFLNVSPVELAMPSWILQAIDLKRLTIMGNVHFADGDLISSLEQLQITDETKP